MTYGEVRFYLSKFFPVADPDLVDLAINNRLETIERHMNWWALRKDANIVTVASYSTGSLALTNGSTAVTLTGGVLTTAMTGRKLIALGRFETYTITRLTDTTGTLDRAYEGDTDTGLGYLIYQDIYDLPADYRMPAHAMNSHLSVELRYRNSDALAEEPVTHGEPVFYSETTRSTDTRRARVYPAPDAAASYPYTYIASIPRMSDATVTTDVPSWISTRGLLAGAKVELGDKDEEITFQTELSSMRAEDCRARGPQALKMAPVFTRHRMERWMGRRPR
jgi:hypothetical protein